MSCRRNICIQEWINRAINYHKRKNTSTIIIEIIRSHKMTIKSYQYMWRPIFTSFHCNSFDIIMSNWSVNQTMIGLQIQWLHWRQFFWIINNFFIYFPWFFHKILYPPIMPISYGPLHHTILKNLFIFYILHFYKIFSDFPRFFPIKCNCPDTL